MDFLRQQLVVLQERLAGLSPSQKMLTGALVIIMIMTLLYWGRFASDREAIALFPNALQASELTNVTAALSARGIPFTADGGVVKVAADKQLEAMSAVTFSEALPAGAANAFEAMLEKISPLDTRGVFNARMKVAREATLNQMLRLGDKSIRTAMCMITEGETGGLERSPSKINIIVTTTGRADKKRIASAAFALAQNAVAGIQLKDITVTIDGAPASNGNLGALAGNDMLDIKTQFQEEAAASIRGLYPYIRGLHVMVTADVDIETKREKSHTVDPTNKVSLPIETITEKTVSTEPAPRGDVGVVPNTGMDVRGENAMAGSSTERTEERNQVEVGKKETEISTPAGMGRIVAASIRVPRSYFEDALRIKTKKDPTEAEVDAMIAAESEKIRAEVRNKIRDAADANVTVAEYIDVDRLLDSSRDAAIASANAGFASLAKGHAKEVAIGVLALTSLFMVSRMVKKSAPMTPEPALALEGAVLAGGSTIPLVSAAGPLVGKKRGKGNNALDGGFDIAGDVTEGGPVMMGRELDDEVLETSQMVEQVASFVSENPDAAAQLVKRWLNRD